MGRRSNLQKYIINMRMIDKRLERQRKKLIKDEAKMMKEVRQALENDDQESAKLFAKDVARSRKMQLNLQTLRSRVKGITFKLEQANAIQAVAGDLRGLVRSLARVNRQMAIPQMEGLLMGMEMEMEQLNLSSEMLEEGFESIADGGVEEDSEADQIIAEFQAARQIDSGLETPDNRSEDINERLKRLKGKDV